PRRDGAHRQRLHDLRGGLAIRVAREAQGGPLTSLPQGPVFSALPRMEAKPSLAARLLWTAAVALLAAGISKADTVTVQGCLEYGAIDPWIESSDGDPSNDPD